MRLKLTDIFENASFEGDSEIKSPATQGVLKALTYATTYSLSAEDLKYLRYTPRIRAGKVSFLELVDSGGMLGNFIVSLSQEEARRAGNVTLEEVVQVILDNGGAKLKRQRARRPRSYSIYD